MITITDNNFDYLCKPSLGIAKTDVLETKEQAKILDFIAGIGFVAEKILVANKAGGADIYATSLVGQTWRIEVKRTKEKSARKLQLTKLKSYHKNKAVCMVAYGFEDFKLKYKYISNLVS